jgi:crotonobetainyl-CoA:carnitine CoA-transferase CaiB-like acyl-CoA transferase
MTAATPSAGPGPLVGIRIIDMSSMVAGPFCSQIMADLGAEVIRIESKTSEPMRAKFPLHCGMAAMFEQMNRGKKSICVDVKTEEGRKLVHGLVRQADMFLQNSRPGVMERLGFGYEGLKKHNDKLIYVSVTGFGEDGPFATRPAYDMVIQGLTGFMPVQGRDEDRPVAIRATVADRVTAMWAANAAMAALLHRNRTGEGQKVSVNMTSAYTAYMMQDQMQNHTFPEADLAPIDVWLAAYRALKTSDGAVIGMVLKPEQCVRFCEVLNCPDLIRDPRFADAMSILKNTNALYDRVAATVSRMTTREFVALMDKAEIPFGKVNSFEEFIHSEEARHSNVFVEIDDPDYGRIRHINYPAKFGRSPANATRRAPLLGEHNDEIPDLLAERSV